LDLGVGFWIDLVRHVLALLDHVLVVFVQQDVSWVIELGIHHEAD